VLSPLQARRNLETLVTSFSLNQVFLGLSRLNVLSISPMLHYMEENPIRKLSSLGYRVPFCWKNFQVEVLYSMKET
jgi:hypothetical protein